MLLKVGMKGKLLRRQHNSNLIIESGGPFREGVNIYETNDKMNFREKNELEDEERRRRRSR